MRGKLSRIFPFAIALICLSSLLLAVGCGSSKARYRFMQTATGVPAPANSVDLQVDGKSVQTAIGFAQTATYHSSSSGNHKFDVFPNGNTTNAIVSDTENLGSGDTTILLQNTQPNSSFILKPYTDDNTAPTTGNAKVRIIHSSFSANPVDVYIVTQGTGIGGLSPSIPNVAFQSATQYQVLAAGSYNVIMTVAGTQNILNNLTFTLTLTAGQIRTLVVVDSSFGGGPFGIVQLNDLN